MLTRKQALEGNDFHEEGSCYLRQGPRGGLRFHYTNWRKNGRVKLWKRSPEKFRIPIKTGLRGPYDYLTNENLGDFHSSSECLVFEKLRELNKSAKYEGYHYTTLYSGVEIANN